MNNSSEKQNTPFIRKMTIDDYDRMVELWKKTPGIGLSAADSKRNIGLFFERNPGLSFVCEIEKIIIGTVLCGHDGRRGYIYHLAVDQKYRKKGIGKELMARSLEKLHQQGILKCHLFLYNDNSDAILFYDNTGWKRRDSLLIYSKDL
jgi:ribosomal protein S18 acetylase RimI-like enzyme